MDILHCFADRGAENPCLSRYGDIYRVGLDPTSNEYSHAIQADAKALPIGPSATFDLGVFHPPCTKWTDMPGADTDNAPNLIPLSRDVAFEHCDHWIIENKPGAPLNDPVFLDGHMFNLPIEWERAFETSFHVEQPPLQQRLAETSPFFYSNRSHEWWAAVKGSDVSFPKEHLAKNTIPAPYLDYLMQYWAKADDSVNREGYVNRERYDDYNEEMDARRAEEANTQLTEYQ